MRIGVGTLELRDVPVQCRISPERAEDENRLHEAQEERVLTVEVNPQPSSDDDGAGIECRILNEACSMVPEGKRAEA